MIVNFKWLGGDESTDEGVNTMVSTLRSGNLGDGKIFVLPVLGYSVGVR